MIWLQPLGKAMTTNCENCDGKGFLNRDSRQITCYVCKGVGRRKLHNLDLLVNYPRKT